MKKRKRLTEATRAEIVRAYLAGESATSIRNRLGLGGMTVRHVVEAAGHEMRSRSAASALAQADAAGWPPEREPTWVPGGGSSVAPARAARAGRAA